MTSPRLPIGVAQTASGTARLPQGLERDQRRTDHARLRAELRDRQPNALAGRHERLDLQHLPRRLEQQLARGDPETAADHDHVRVEEVHERGDGSAEVPPDLRQRGMAQLDEVPGGCGRPERRLGEAVGRAPEQYDST